MTMFWRFTDAVMDGAKEVISGSFYHVLAALVFLFIFTSRLIPALLRLMRVEQPATPEYRMVVARPDKLKYLVLLPGVSHFYHIHFVIREDSELFITAGRLVKGMFEKLQLCIPLPVGGSYNIATTETSFDQASCILTIALKSFETSNSV